MSALLGAAVLGAAIGGSSTSQSQSQSSVNTIANTFNPSLNIAYGSNLDNRPNIGAIDQEAAARTGASAAASGGGGVPSLGSLGFLTGGDVSASKGADWVVIGGAVVMAFVAWRVIKK